jgi:cytosine/adenosine deaminase-related metal-dependent hydrolase
LGNPVGKNPDSRIVFYNATILAGPELTYVKGGTIEIKGGNISSVSYTADSNTSLSEKGSTRKPLRGQRDRAASHEGRDARSFDAAGLLIMPAFVNAHTHIGDSIGKDLGSSLGLDARVNPVFGMKRSILEKTPSVQLKSFIRFSAISMLRKGIVTFADFREGGLDGVKLLREAIKGLPIRCIALGRSQHHSPDSGFINAADSEAANANNHVSSQERRNSSGSLVEFKTEISEVLRSSDGFGISGANEHSDETLVTYRQVADGATIGAAKHPPRIAIHAAESAETVATSKAGTGKTELERIHATLKPDILVHMTCATESDFAVCARRGTGIVTCPRANGVIGAGFPSVSLMVDKGCTVAIGTDNVMLNSPDMFREMDYVWKASRAIEKGRKMLEAREVVKMATVNGAKVLGVNSGCIEPGRSADFVFLDANHIDLSPIHDPYATIVQRASPESIKAVMFAGRFVDLISDCM